VIVGAALAISFGCVSVNASMPISRPTPTGPIPLLCHQCGGPVGAADGRTSRCPHCGAFDRLPAHNLERALELKRRLQRAARAVAQLDGFELRLASLYEQRRRFAWTLLPLALAAAALSTLVLVELGPLVAHRPRILETPAVRQLAAGAIWLGGMAMAAGLGLLIGRRHYRRAVRPHVLGRAPLSIEQPPRCRACAADLAPAPRRRPFARCRYCSTVSVATRPSEDERQLLLMAEEARLREGTPTARPLPSPWALTRMLALTLAGSATVMLALLMLSSLWRR
jgi:hypothetical protein